MPKKKQVVHGAGFVPEEDYGKELPEMPETFSRVIGDIIEGEIKRRQDAMNRDESERFKKKTRSGTKTYGPKETVRKKGVY